MSDLLERVEETAELKRALHEVRSGGGRIVAIEGPPGIGKTSLLDASCDLARADGIVIRRAGCGEFERDLAFGVARQLFPEVLDRDHTVTDFQVFDALHWASAEIAVDVPLLLAVDDAHWADSGTLAWFRYLGRRLADLRVVVVLSVRSDEVPAADDALRDVVAMADHLVLRPLTAGATTTLLRDTLGTAPEERFAFAFHRATGGNPFLATELARAMRSQGVRPVDPEAWTIGSLRPQAIVRNIEGRLRRLPDNAQALAQAAAVFGMQAEFRHAAALAALDADDAARAADALHGAWIVRNVDPLWFEHSVTRDAILAELSPARLARDHKRAADALAAEGAPAERVAGHLLLTTPVGDPGTVRCLRDAADIALRRGAPAAACTYLERALIEPPPTSSRWEVAWALGRAETLLGRPSAREHVRAALDQCEDPAARRAIVADLVQATVNVGSLVEAYELLAEEIGDELDDDVLPLEAKLLFGAQLDHDLQARANERVSRLEQLQGDTPGQRAALAAAAYIRANDGTPRVDVLRLLGAAYADGGILDDHHDDPLLLTALSRAAANFGEVDIARALLERAADEARLRGSLSANAGTAMARAALELTVGDVGAASDAVEQCDALLSGSSLLGPSTAVVALRVWIAVERDELDEAHALLESAGLLGPLPPFGVLDQLLFHRGVLHGKRGNVEAAVDDLLELGRREAIAGTQMSVSPWRAEVAPLLARLGRRAEAERLVADELAVAQRRGAPKPLAVARRAEATLCSGDQQLALIEDSVRLLETTPFRLELAHSLLELGAALRRANRRAEARIHLQRVLDLAVPNGATALQSRARIELQAAGARPRRLVTTGLESLTASERRVAELAATGRSNPEIAAALYVTRKTVETHLGRVYQKLAIGDRRRLAEVMSVTPPA